MRNWGEGETWAILRNKYWVNQDGNIMGMPFCTCVRESDRATTEFFTCRTASPVAIYQHIDHYEADHYKVNSVSGAIASCQKN